MKGFKNILFFALAFTLMTGCDDDGYIDPITPVDPGSDQAAPVANIIFPSDDIIIPFTDTITSVDFRFEAEDDIEIESITLSLNGTELNSWSTFKDYRKFTGSFNYEDLGLGEHTVRLEVEDMAGKTTTDEITFEVTNQYVKKYEGEVFYMPFEGQSYMELINETSANVVGNPGFSDNAVQGGSSYKGAEGSYLTFPTDLLDLGSEFSATFWMNINADPTRAGILVIGPPDLANPNAMNNRTSGFRFFREGSATNQTFKLNVGTGLGDTWFDGGAAASINPSVRMGWIHLAFTISETEAKVYIDGQLVKEGTFAGVSWLGTDILSIMSGAPRFTGWNHLSDQSLMDELRIFNRALTQQEIQQIIADES